MKKIHTWQEQQRIGQMIADQLPERATRSEVARNMGMTSIQVQYAERQALYKLAMALLAEAEKAELPITNRFLCDMLAEINE